MRRAVLLAAALLTLAAPASAQRTFQTSAGPVEARAVGPEFDHPWSMAFLPDFAETGAMLITERDGRLRLLENGRTREVAGLPEIEAGGQGGLFDVVLAPDFAETGTLFLAYAAPGPSGGANTAVTRAVLDREAPRLTGATRIFQAEPFSSGGRHFGGRLVIAPDGTLFVTTGDRGRDDTAQDPFSANGKVHRIAPDGSVPPDNPFADGKEALPTVWSLGHRNAQGAVWDPEGGTLVTIAHGARGGDEVNRPRAGRNYGWPVISHGRHYSGGKIGEGTSKPGMEQPLTYWDPSIAPSGATIYDGDLFPEWRGDLFTGGLRAELLSRLTLEGDAAEEVERLFVRELGRIRDVRTGPDGALWLLTDEGDGRLWRIAPPGR